MPLAVISVCPFQIITSSPYTHHNLGYKEFFFLMGEHVPTGSQCSGCVSVCSSVQRSVRVTSVPRSGRADGPLWHSVSHFFSETRIKWSCVTNPHSVAPGKEMDQILSCFRSICCSVVVHAGQKEVKRSGGGGGDDTKEDVETMNVWRTLKHLDFTSVNQLVFFL